MIVSNFLWNKIVKKYSFKGVIKSAIGIEIILPIIALLAAHSNSIYFFSGVFFVAGMAMSAFKIAYEGMFLEITNETNRAMYQGIKGSLNVTVAFFPLISGVLISYIGFIPIFVGASAVAIFALTLPKRIKCG